MNTDQKYSGTVYEEISKMPLKGVLITDGRNVVKTDEKGIFFLDGLEKTKFITITVPSDYAVQRHYIAVTNSIRTYDFALTRKPANTNEHSFLHISDTEIGENGAGVWLDETKRLVQALKPDFLIHTGDICYEAGLKQHIHDMNDATMGCKVHYVIGNHDYVDGDYGEQLFESIYGPIWYSFEVGNIHYVVTPIQNGDFASGYDENERWIWLKNDLKNTSPDKKVIIFNHSNFHQNSDYVINLKESALDLKKYNLIAWICGHYHFNFINNVNDILTISTARPDCGGVNHSPSSTRQIFINKDCTISTKLHFYDISNQNVIVPNDKIWSTKIDGNILFCDILAIKDVVFIGTTDDDFPRSCGVFALNATTGEIIWKFHTQNSINNNLGYYANKIIAQDSEGVVYCFNAENGTLIWQKCITLNNPYNSSLGLCINNGIAYVGDGTRITALCIETGNIVWGTSIPGSESSPIRLIINGNKLIGGAHWSKLYALDIKTGTIVWDLAENSLRFRSTTPYCLDYNRILISSSNKLFVLDCANGKILKQQEHINYNFDVASKPLVENNITYISTANKGIVAFNIDTLEEIWNFNTEKALIYTSPYTSGNSQTVESSITLYNSHLIFGASDGFLYVLNKQNGTLVKKSFLGSPIFSAVSIYENSIIIADFFGRITRLPINI